MTDLLIAFVIPVLVIIVSAILQTVFNCPFKVAGIIFVAAIIAALVLGGTAILIALAWIFTVLAFIVAFIICKFFRWECNSNRNCLCCSNDNNSTNGNTGNNNSGNNNTGNNNSGNNNTGNNNSGNNNTGNNNSGNNNTGNNNSGNNNTGNNNGNNNNNDNNCNRCCRCWRG